MNGARVGITAARRADEQAALVRALGGVPVHGPSVDVDVPAPDHVMRGTLEDLLASRLDIAVFLTGVGARRLFGAAARSDMLAAVMAHLRAARVIVRGTKPRRVLREFDVPIEWTASPAESRVIRDALLAEGVADRRILVQCAGAAPDAMIDALRAAGAQVVAAHPYAIDTPPDAAAALRLATEAAAGRLDALTFTSAHAVHGFVGLAERAGVDLDSVGTAGTLIVAVGPVTRDALLGFGLPVHVEPEVPRMGAMFRDLAAALTASDRLRSSADR
jgi:uroporphyrinogen-III synthase